MRYVKPGVAQRFDRQAALSLQPTCVEKPTLLPSFERLRARMEDDPRGANSTFEASSLRSTGICSGKPVENQVQVCLTGEGDVKTALPSAA